MKITYFTEKEHIEDNALSQLQMFEQEEHISQISVFPDIHYCSEKNVPVGVAFKSTDVFYPLITGKDMGCGVAFLRIDKKDYLKPFDKKHFNAFDKEMYLMTDEGLGSGNHFLSIEESDLYLYIIVHTGSRNLGIYMYQKMLGLLEKYNNKHFLPKEVATEEFIIDYDRVLNYATSRRNQFLTKSFDFLVKNKYINAKANFEIKDSIHNHLRFGKNGIIHRKGSTELINDEIVIPLSMTRGCLIVKPNVWNTELENSINSCSHGAGRKLSRTDTLKYWYSLKKSEKEMYTKSFPEYLNKSKELDKGYIQEMDFAYKDSKQILISQPYLIKTDETKPIITTKFVGL